MPIGYVTGNQGESRYTVAIPRKTPLLAALIEARKVEIEGIDKVLEELRKHETDRRAIYDAAMEDVHLATLMYTECRESYTEPQCRADKIAAANSAYSDARNVCIDTWRDCRFACDIGDGDCQEACDDTRDACELAAETARDRALAAVGRLCVDEVVAHMAACQAEHAPIIAKAQAAAVEALAPLQDAMIAIAWERTKRTSAVRRLNELEAIESSAESATCWSAQYNDKIPTGEVPEDPTGTEENAVTVATVSGRAIITEIVSINPCAHDARALPADVLFVDAALAPGAETWRPTWRTGIVTEIYDPAEPGDWPDPDKPLRVRIDPAILPGTLGTRVSRRNIECTPPGAFFDANGELDARLGIARQEYEDAIEARNEILAEIQACKDGYSVQDCAAPRNEVCEYNREQSMSACIEARNYCLSIATDNNGIQYCLDQFDACEQQVETIFSACVDGATADCIEAKRQHDAQCEQASQFALSQAETAVSTAQRNLLNASADIQGPPFELILDVAVEHCFPDSYEVGDDVLIDFPERGTSTGLDWSTATSEQIRAAAMKVWKSAQVVGWASETRQCAVRGIWQKLQYEDGALTSIDPALVWPRAPWVAPPSGYEQIEPPRGGDFAIQAEQGARVDIINGGGADLNWRDDIQWNNATGTSTATSTPKTYLINGSIVHGWPWKDALGIVRYVMVSAVLVSQTNSETGRLVQQTADIEIRFGSADGSEYPGDSPSYLPPMMFTVTGSPFEVSDMAPGEQLRRIGGAYRAIAHNAGHWVDLGVLSLSRDGAKVALVLACDYAVHYLDFVIVDLSAMTHESKLFCDESTGSLSVSETPVSGTVYRRRVDSVKTESDPLRKTVEFTLIPDDFDVGTNETTSGSVSAPIWWSFDEAGNLIETRATYTIARSRSFSGYSVEVDELTGTSVHYPPYVSGRAYATGDIVRTARLIYGTQYWEAKRGGNLAAPPSRWVGNSNWDVVSPADTSAGAWSHSASSTASLAIGVKVERISPGETTTIYEHTQEVSTTGTATTELLEVSGAVLDNNGAVIETPAYRTEYQRPSTTTITGSLEASGSWTSSKAFGNWIYAPSFNPDSRYAHLPASTGSAMMSPYESSSNYAIVAPFGYSVELYAVNEARYGAILPNSGAFLEGSSEAGWEQAHAVDIGPVAGFQPVLQMMPWEYSPLDIHQIRMVGYIADDEQAPPDPDPTPDPEP